MNKIKQIIDVEDIINKISNRKGRIKYNIEYIQKILQSVNEIGVNRTSKKFNISKSNIKAWRTPNWNITNLKKQYAKHPNKYKKYKDKRYKEKRKYCIEINKKCARKRYRTNPSFRLGCLLRTRVWRVLKEQSATKYEKFNDYIGCSTKELKEYIEAKFQPNMTWDNYGKWHIDHIKPCSSFNLTEPEEQKACFHYTNLQPLWAEDNLKKSNKLNNND